MDNRDTYIRVFAYEQNFKLLALVLSVFWHLAQSGVETAVAATSARYGHEI